jgi:hypothetical protein
MTRGLVAAFYAAVLALLGAGAAGAAEPPLDPTQKSFFLAWDARVEEATASQPHWLPPLNTPSPLITQLIRQDGSFQWLGNGDQMLNLGGNKGVFLVPAKTLEVDLGTPSFQQKYGASPAYGLTDWQFLQVKQRLLSANREQGDYIVSAAFAAQAPIGATAFTNNTVILTPTLSAGKGIGDLNLQAATALAIPTTNGGTIGTAWQTNATLQYQLGPLWPEFEVNWTHWMDGSQRGGLDEVYLTVGMLVGPIHITPLTAVVFGGGYQFAVAPAQRLQPVLTPAFHDAVVFSARLVF